MIQLPRFVLNLVGYKTTENTTITRVISMDSETDDVQVQVKNDKTNEEHKTIVPICKVLNILGYFVKEQTKKKQEND